MSTHCVLGSNGVELHFPDKEMYDRYQEDCKKLAVKYYREIREKHGVWASNQNKFVPTADALRPADCRYMEDLAGFEEKPLTEHILSPDEAQRLSDIGHNIRVARIIGIDIGFDPFQAECAAIWKKAGGTGTGKFMISPVPGRYTLYLARS